MVSCRMQRRPVGSYPWSHRADAWLRCRCVRAKIASSGKAGVLLPGLRMRAQIRLFGTAVSDAKLSGQRIACNALMQIIK